MNKESTREELFARVWEKPVQVVAKELGISGVALAKRCRALQVPTPPRGYWAKIRSGQHEDRPPLANFIEELRVAQQKPVPEDGARLAAAQGQMLKTALAELQQAGFDTSAVRCPGYEVAGLTPDMAAEVILHIQRSFRRWTPPGASWQKQHGVHACAGGLVSRLLPLARGQILILKIKSEARHGLDRDGYGILRVAPAFLHDVALLLALVRTNRLDYAARPINASDRRWSVGYFSGRDETGGHFSRLCVSETEFWLLGKAGWREDEKELETSHLRLSDIMPTELLVPEFIDGPTSIPESRLRPFEETIRAIEFADGLHETLSLSCCTLGDTLPNETLVLVERLWFGTGDDGAFGRQRRQLQELESQLEQWEAIIDSEKEAVTKNVLGISRGDHVSFERADGIVKMRVTGTSVHIGETNVDFFVFGNRYRKDGLLGQRQETLCLTVARRPTV